MSKSVVRRVGIIGLGKMGHPMARHLRKAGFDVTAYDIDARACSEAQRAGIGIAAHPAAVAQQSDFVIVVVGVFLGVQGSNWNAARGDRMIVERSRTPRYQSYWLAEFGGCGPFAPRTLGTKYRRQTWIVEYTPCCFLHSRPFCTRLRTRRPLTQRASELF